MSTKHRPARSLTTRTGALLATAASVAALQTPLLASSALASVSSCRPAVVDLGTLGGPSGNVLDISSTGLYVGDAEDGTISDLDIDPPDGEPELNRWAVYWDSDGIHRIHSGLELDQVLDVNERGRMVGFGYDRDRQAWRSWLRQPNGSIIMLPSLGGDFTRARRINEHGVIAGGGNTHDGGFYWHAARWQSPYTKADLLPRTGSDVYASAINNHGVLAGMDVQQQTAQGTWRVFNPQAWTSSKQPFTLPKLGLDAGVWQLNDAMQATGLGSVHDPARPAGQDNFELHAMFWDPNGVRDLGVLPGGQFSHGLGVSDGGWVAGLAETGPMFSDDATPHPFLWTGHGPVKVLPSLSGGTDWRTWLGIAHPVNDERDEVGGKSIDDQGRDRPTVWRCASKLAVDVGAIPAGDSTSKTWHGTATGPTRFAGVARNSYLR